MPAIKRKMAGGGLAATIGAAAPAIYGGVQGFRDQRQDSQREDAFQTDQAIRRTRLENEQAEAPLRRRSLEMGVQEQERQAIRRPAVESDEDTLRKLNIDATKLTVDERTDLAKQAREARAKEQRLNLGLGDFHASGDPQKVADAIAEIYPQQNGNRPRAVREADGSITLTSVNAQGEAVGQPIRLEPKEIAGSIRSPDDQLAMFAYRMANPVQIMKDRHAADTKIEVEGEKQAEMTTRAIERERIRNEGRVADADRRASAAGGRAADRGIRLGKTFVDSSLKTVSVPGHFQATYSSEDDAKLLPHIYSRMGNIIRTTETEPEDAAKKAINDVRTEFLTSKKAVMEAADRLRKAKIDPRDNDALAKARAAGNKDVDALLDALGKTSKSFGPDVGNYLLEQIPAKK